MIRFLIYFIDILFQVLSLAILARVILSWFRVDPYNRFVQILVQVTEPVLGLFRRLIPPMGMIDITPIVALLVLQVAQQIIVNMLARLLDVAPVRDPLTTRLAVRLTPRSGRDEVTGIREDVLHVRVTAPPVDGAANEALVALIAKQLGLPRANVVIAHGHGSRTKLVDVLGLDRDAVLARLLPAGQAYAGQPRPHGQRGAVK